MTIIRNEKVKFNKDYLINWLDRPLSNTDMEVIDLIIGKFNKIDSIKFYIEQSDIKNMLWGKEILKIIGGNDERK